MSHAHAVAARVAHQHAAIVSHAHATSLGSDGFNPGLSSAALGLGGRNLARASAVQLSTFATELALLRGGQIGPSINPFLSTPFANQFIVGGASSFFPLQQSTFSLGTGFSVFGSPFTNIVSPSAFATPTLFNTGGNTFNSFGMAI